MSKAAYMRESNLHIFTIDSPVNMKDRAIEILARTDKLVIVRNRIKIQNIVAGSNSKDMVAGTKF